MVVELTIDTIKDTKTKCFGDGIIYALSKYQNKISPCFKITKIEKNPTKNHVQDIFMHLKIIQYDLF